MRRPSGLNAQYKAPQWAIELRSVYKFFNADNRGENAYGVFHAGRCALEAQFGCSFDDSTGFFHSDVEPIESSDGSFSVVKTVETTYQPV
jgi:hypothetical protein